MSTIAEYYQQAELAFAAYADLYSDISEDEYKKANLADIQALVLLSGSSRP